MSCPFLGLVSSINCWLVHFGAPFSRHFFLFLLFFSVGKKIKKCWLGENALLQLIPCFHFV